MLIHLKVPITTHPTLSRNNFLNFFGGHKFFLWGHWDPCPDFWWCLPWVSKPGWIPLLVRACTSSYNRFTSGVTSAYILATSMAAEPLWSTYLNTSIGGALIQDECSVFLKKISQLFPLFYRISVVAVGFWWCLQMSSVLKSGLSPLNTHCFICYHVTTIDTKPKKLFFKKT